MSAQDGSDYTHDEVPWTRVGAALLVLALMTVGLVIALKVNAPVPPEPVACKSDNRFDCDRGKCAPVPCNPTNKENR